MTDFTLEERKVIYNAIKKWQMDVPFNGKIHQVCNDILNRIFDEHKQEEKVQ